MIVLNIALAMIDNIINWTLDTFVGGDREIEIEFVDMNTIESNLQVTEKEVTNVQLIYSIVELELSDIFQKGIN